MPLARSSTEACVSQRSAIQEQPATPQPRIRPACVPVPSWSQYRRARRPAEFFRADVEALHHVTRREGKVEAFILLGLVEEAELDGVELQFDGQLVDGGLQGKEAGNSAGTAHGGWCADVAPDEAGSGAQVGDAVAVGRGLAAALRVIVQERGMVERVVHQRDELAVWRGAEADRCWVRGRWPTFWNIMSRVTTSLTGRPRLRAAAQR